MLIEFTANSRHVMVQLTLLCGSSDSKELDLSWNSTKLSMTVAWLYDSHIARGSHMAVLECVTPLSHAEGPEALHIIDRHRFKNVLN